MLDVKCQCGSHRWMFSESRYLSPVKSTTVRISIALLLVPLCAFASNSVVNLSHYDLIRVDFVAMKNEGVVGVIHEATFPRLQRDWRYRLRQMLYGSGATAAHRAVLSNCWLWIANYHNEPRATSPWQGWDLWQYTGDGKCGLRPRSAFPISVANLRKAERNIFRGNNALLQAFWQEHAWFPRSEERRVGKECRSRWSP